MSNLDLAVHYARRGWRVVPLWWITEQGTCACGEGAACGGKSGKHPFISDWVNRATTDTAMLTAWWHNAPNLQVGVATGPGSGIFVVDVDPKNGGDRSLAEWEREHGALPKTVESKTGSGGRHLFFRYPEGGVKNGPWYGVTGVDIKAQGGQVVLFPSRNLNGPYIWTSDPDTSFADAPQSLLESINAPRAGTATQMGSGPEAPPEVISEGSRNDTLFRYACQLRRRTRDDRTAVWGAVHALNVQACQPPLPQDEVELIIASAFAQDHHDEELPQWARLQATVEEAMQSDRPPITPMPSDDELADRTSDLGNAKRFVRRNYRDVRYAPSLGWIIWSGTHWKRDELEYAQELAKQTTMSIFVEAATAEDDETRDRLVRHGRASESHRAITSMLKLAQSDEQIATPADRFDQDPWLLNCPNGTLDLRTGKMLEHDIDHLITHLCTTEYHPDARCPRWLRFLERVLPDSATREFVRRAVGYSLTGVTSEKVMFILYGAGNNGKSVFLETLREVIGEYAANTPTSMFVNQQQGGIPNDVARLRGARFATASETEKGARMNVSLVKGLTGGDTITARFLRQEFFEFTPELKLWLATNHPPRTNDFGDALWNRLRFVPFTVAIPPEEQRPRHELDAELLAEREGILRWAVEGCLTWQKEATLTAPEGVVLATNEQRTEHDLILQFADDALVLEHDAWTPVSDIYSSFTIWWIQQGEPAKPIAQRWFTAELQQRIPELRLDKRGRVRGISGAKLRAQAASVML